MTNRRRSGKGRTSVSKKAETPEKQTRKLTRRSRRSKKSESPEVAQEVDSDYSGDEVVEERENRKLDGEQKNESVESVKSNEDQRSQTREEESGGSDGSWKVKSENGGGGGIPKLKLCLTRPPEMSSPTSVEQQPSPRKRRRGGRGNATPTKEEDHPEENVVEECSKRITRNQRAKNLSETEAISEGKSTTASVSEALPTPEPEPDVKSESKSEVQLSEPKATSELPPTPVEKCEALLKAKTTEPEQKSQLKPEEKLQQDVDIQSEQQGAQKINNSRCIEEDETRMAVESICGIKQSGGNESSGPIEEVKFQQAVKEVEKTVLLVAEESNELQKEDSSEKKLDQKIDNLESQISKSECTTEKSQSEASGISDLQNEFDSSGKPEVLPLQEAKAENVTETRRSSSRDSSEERAKEAALRSRNKNKKRDEEFKNEMNRRTRSDVLTIKGSDKSEEKESSVSQMNKIDAKENVEEPMAAKSSGARKRRWGSSTNKNSKKPSVSISTDFLKEIIPEAKPLLPSEVQLSPNNEDEEGQLKESEDNLSLVAKKPEREKIVQSDESEKDYEEEVGESGGDDTVQPEPAKPPPPPHKEKEPPATFTRKVSVLSSNEKLQKSPSPPRHKPSKIIYIVNLVRPFTIPQLRELLARTGTIVEDGFWIDKIKSKCYVKYETEEEAKTTRHALHGVRWPVSNPKQLIVDFGTEAAMKAAIEGNEVATKRPIPSLFEKQIDLKSGDLVRDREKDNIKAADKRERVEKDKKERGKYREDEKRGDDEEEEEKKSRPVVEPLVRDRTVRRVTMPIREWDVGKNEDGFSPPPECVEFSRHRNDRYERRVEYDRDKKDDYEDRRRREKDRNRRSVSGEPPRKSKKKEEETPAKLLDDLFRKTKATPCIYWLPLTPEQISVKEEMRRKHMAEHEKKVAEMRKMQREQGKRGSDKRRRRTKSRSRSRSVKK